jgi:mannose-6-phosphate isomerase-like protein (cupin superfamily)
MTTLNPHYHKQGIEIYQILEGEGIMQVGDIQNNKINWNGRLNVKQGDFFSIEESKIHQLSNGSEKSLIAVFTCPESHLGDDRFFV